MHFMNPALDHKCPRREEEKERGWKKITERTKILSDELWDQSEQGSQYEGATGSP